MLGALSDAISTLEAALQACLASPQSGGLDAEDGRRNVQPALQAVSAGATKVGVSFKGAPPNLAETKSLLEDFLRSSLALCTCLACLGVGGNTFLLAALRHTAHEVVGGCIHLLKAVRDGEEQAINRRCGAVMEACKAAAKAPIDVKTAVGRELTRRCMAVKDVLREMGEMLESSPSDKPEADGDVEDDDDGFDNTFDCEFDPSEMEFVRAATPCAGTVLAHHLPAPATCSCN